MYYFLIFVLYLKTFFFSRDLIEIYINISFLINIMKKRFREYTILLLRISIGWLIFYAGITKILTPGWSTKQFLLSSTFLNSFFSAMAGNVVVDWLVMLGLTLIGLSLLFGLFVKISSLMGIIMMILFYLPYYPPKHGLVDEHVIYIMVFLVLIGLNAGKIYGLESNKFISRIKWLKKII